jgi:hypothetical protein
MVLRKIFGPKRDGITGEWKTLHSEEIPDFTPHQILFG